jgi:beta-glucosidase
VAVVVLGERYDMSGEIASRSTLDIPGDQLELLRAVVATGTPTVLVLMSGRPLDLRECVQTVPAILQIWHPGTRGGSALADLLFGRASPGGKLPVTWPRSVGQVPLIYSHTRSHQPEGQGSRYWEEASTPLFPFGFGLSYASFAYEAVEVSPSTLRPDGAASVSVRLRNTGAVRADEVVQLYVGARSGRSARPVRELKGFKRVTLEPGEVREVSLELAAASLSYWSAADRQWGVDAGVYDVWVGGDSTASLAAELRVEEAS